MYGSLRRGHANHGYLAGAPFLGEGRTAPAFRNVDVGEWPAVTAGGTTAIAGEVYAVDAERLRILDELEGHPHLYARTEVRLEDGGRAWMYLLAARGPA